LISATLQIKSYQQDCRNRHIRRKIRIFVVNKQIVEIMIYSKFFKGKRSEWKNSKQFLKSTTDLRLLPEQVIYVEGSYNGKINKIISKKYDEISVKLKSSKLSAEFIYFPFVARQLQDSTSLTYILKYYYPSLSKVMSIQDVSAVFQTDIISHPLFSCLEYNEKINPVFFVMREKIKKICFPHV
jgi:hypothetical protein